MANKSNTDNVLVPAALMRQANAPGAADAAMLPATLMRRPMDVDDEHGKGAAKFQHEGLKVTSALPVTSNKAFTLFTD